MKHCKHHVGRSTAMAKALGEANLIAWSTQAQPSADRVPLDPGRVVLDQLRVAVLRADLYGEMLRWQLEVDEESGLVSPTFVAGATGQAVATGEQVRGLTRLEAEWRDRAVRFAKTAHDMGIDQRRIELEEGQAGEVVAAAIAMCEVLRLSAEQRELGLRAFLGSLGSVDGAAVLEAGGAG
jgi:hypothetical protein